MITSLIFLPMIIELVNGLNPVLHWYASSELILVSFGPTASEVRRDRSTKLIMTKPYFDWSRSESVDPVLKSAGSVNDWNSLR